MKQRLLTLLDTISDAMANIGYTALDLLSGFIRITVIAFVLVLCILFWIILVLFFLYCLQ